MPMPSQAEPSDRVLLRRRHPVVDNSGPGGEILGVMPFCGCLFLESLSFLRTHSCTYHALGPFLDLWVS